MINEIADNVLNSNRVATTTDRFHPFSLAVRNGYIGSLASPSAGRVFYSYPKGALSPYPKRRRPVAILVHKDIGVNGQLAKANEALRRMSRQARDGP